LLRSSASLKLRSNRSEALAKEDTSRSIANAKKNKLRVSVISAFFLVVVSLIAFQEVSFAHLFSDIAEKYHRQGYDEQLKGNYQDALTYYYKTVSLEPQNSVYLNDLGLVYEQLDRLDGAEKSYLAAIEVNPQYLPPYTNLGYFYKRKQDLVKAIYFFQKRIEFGDPVDPWTKKTREELEKLYLSAPYFKEKFMQAETKRLNLQASQQSRQNFQGQIRVAKAEYLRGLELLKEKKPQDALKAFNSSLAFAPSNPKVLKARKEALRQCRQTQVAQHVETAMQMIDEGNEEAAKQQFSQILTIIPGNSKSETLNSKQ